MNSRFLEKRGRDSEEIFKALASGTRLKILELLAERDMNINELCQALQIVHPSISKHIQILEQAGLVSSDYMPGAQGTQKRCRLRYDQLLFAFDTPQVAADLIEEIEMPLGLYTLVHPTPTCGLSSREGPIGLVDDPRSFLLPERAGAQILWMADGFVEYVFSNWLPTSVEIHRLEVVMEICSEAPDFKTDHPSDITVWVNNIEIGTWTSPGDFGGKRGRHNPAWYSDHGTQYGSLKTWSTTADGSFVDGMAASAVTIQDLMVLPQQPITVRIGIKPDARHIGGFNLFGRGFGNYEQDLLLRMHYAPTPQSEIERERRTAAREATESQ